MFWEVSGYTWCVKMLGQKSNKAWVLLTAFSMWGPPSSCGPGSPSVLYKVYTAAARLWVHCPALPPYKGAVVTWSGVPWLGEPATPVFIVHLHYLYRQILWADEFHPKQLLWLLTKPHLVVSAPSASHRYVALFGHCIMKATFTSCEGRLKISSDFSSKLWLRPFTGTCLDHRGRVVGEEAPVKFRGNKKEQPEKSRLVVCDPECFRDWTGTKWP